MDKDEYQQYLTAIDLWDSFAYNSKTWPTKWPEEMKTLGSKSKLGVDKAAFNTLYMEYRADELQSDYDSIDSVRHVPCLYTLHFHMTTLCGRTLED